MATVDHNGLVSSHPDFVTHYYRGDRRPFQNLGDLDEAELAEVLQALDSPWSRSLSHRRFGPRYMDLRRATEDHARQLFTAAGGRPQRRSPHYFVLGESAWFAGLYLDVRSFKLAIDKLPLQATTFTLTDSVTALGLGEPFGVPIPPGLHQRQIYRLDQLAEVIERFGMPSSAAGRNYANHQHELVDQFIEVQLWSDEPIAAELSRYPP